MSTTGVKPEVIVYSLDGTIRSIIRIDLPVERVTNRDRQQIRAILQRQRNGAENEQERTLIGSILANIRFAADKAFWKEIESDGYGYIWLRYHSYASMLEELYAAFRIISPEGEYLGDTSWPVPRGSLSRGHLLTIREDKETGEQQLEIFKISSNISSFTYPE